MRRRRAGAGRASGPRIGRQRVWRPESPRATPARRSFRTLRGEVEAHHPEQGVQEPFGLELPAKFVGKPVRYKQDDLTKRFETSAGEDLF